MRPRRQQALTTMNEAEARANQMGVKHLYGIDYLRGMSLRVSTNRKMRSPRTARRSV